MLEDLANTFVGLGGALEVLLSADLLADILGLCRSAVSILPHSTLLGGASVRAV